MLHRDNAWKLGHFPSTDNFRIMHRSPRVDIEFFGFSFFWDAELL